MHSTTTACSQSLLQIKAEFAALLQVQMGSHAQLRYWELPQPGKGMSSEGSLCSAPLHIFSTLLKYFVLLKVVSEQCQNLIQLTEAFCKLIKSFILSQTLFVQQGKGLLCALDAPGQYGKIVWN